MSSNFDRDECFGLTWNGLEPSSAGPEIRRVHLEQLGLILVPNAMKPTELIELVLINSKEVRSAFFILMKTAGRFSLMDMYDHLKSVLPPSPRGDEDTLRETYPYLHATKTSAGPRLVGQYALADEPRFRQLCYGRPYFRGSTHVTDECDHQEALLAACDEFHRTLGKAIGVQASKVSGRMASSLDDVRVDDVWGNFYYLAADLKTDASHLVLQILLLDWLAVAATAIPGMLKHAQKQYAQETPYGDSPYTDLFYRLRGSLDRDAPHRGGFDATTFATLLHMQHEHGDIMNHEIPMGLYKIEFTRMWASASVRAIIGNVVAALWEEASRSTSGNISGVLTSLCYALTTDSEFMMGNPARTDDCTNERAYNQHRPTIPSGDAGTSWRIVDAVRIAQQALRECIYNGSHIICEYNSDLTPRQACSVRQCLLWYGVLDWFHIGPLPTPAYPSTHLDILAPAAVETPAAVEMSSIEEAMAQVHIISGDHGSDDSDDSDDEYEEDDNILVQFRTTPAPLINADGTVREVIQLYPPVPVVPEMPEDDDGPTPPSSPMRFDSLIAQGDDGDSDSDDEGVEHTTPFNLAFALGLRPCDAYSLGGPLPIAHYNTRPNQRTLDESETRARDFMRDREAYLHGVGPYQYVRASGDHDNIVLPPHLVDNRRRSGNVDGVMTRNLALEAMESDDDGSATAAGFNASRELQGLLAFALRAAFPFAPPLREAATARANNLKTQAMAAIVRGMALQLAHTDFVLDRPAALDFLTAHLRRSKVTYQRLMVAVAKYGHAIGRDMRLGIVAENRVPRLGRAHDGQAPQTRDTLFVWIYHDYTRRTLGDRVWPESFQALRPVDSVVGHGRESHFWLGVRQAVFRAWRI